ncbi:MAG: hypothetical protein IJY88_02910 [Clostridia bacterium]|nr:hypothetical protein [Clostridia bacterium]
MKKVLIILTALLMLSSVFFAACENDGDKDITVAESSVNTYVSDTEGNDASDGKQESKDESKAEGNDESKAEGGNDESSKAPEKETAKLPTEYKDGGMNIEAASFSEKPYFVIVGKCAEGATVTGEANGETVSSKSYKGWYSVRLKCSGKTADVKLTQTVDGKQVGEALEYRIKPVTPSADMWPVVAGGDFQFFFQKMLPDFKGENLPKKLHLDNLEIRIKNRLKAMREVNPDSEIVYLLVPSAMSVYPELVPSQYKQASGDTKYDLIVKQLEAGGATVIDLKGAFAKHKNDELPLYYKLDSHWSDYGAFVAYTELFNHISKSFPEAAPRGFDEFNWNEKYRASGDMTYYLQMSQTKIQEYTYYRTFKDSVPSSITGVPRYVSENKLTYHDAMTYENNVGTGNSKLPKCLVMRDSYSTQMYDILAERTSSTHYLGMWNYTWDKAYIQREAPDYVIYIVAEWNLDAVLNG